MQIKIAARKSDLARLQAYRVGEALKLQYENIDIQYQFSASLGDQNQNSPLWQMPEKGVFTSDLTERLVRGECDMVVHSFKDLPIDERAETLIAATLPRADSRDLLLFRKSALSAEIDKLHILSSSPRRILNIGEFLTWALPLKANIQFQTVRGNIATRVQKLLTGDAQGLVVAKAAIDRLLAAPEPEFLDSQKILLQALQECRWMIVPHTVNPCAPAQGALAIEVARARADIIELVQKINCEKTLRSVQSERQWLKKYGGGCHQKIGISRLDLSYGEIEIQKGEIENDPLKKDGVCALHTIELLQKTKVAAGEANNKNQREAGDEHGPGDASAQRDLQKVFPLKMSDSVFFQRKKRAIDLNKLKGRNLWVVKDRAWPEGFVPDENQVVWSSGLSTWRKLAQMGVWVNGSHEGFGENEKSLLQVSTLLGAEPKFLKLSHNEAVGLSENELFVTYDLHDIDHMPDLKGKTHFFWASYSSFRRAVAKNPEILTAHHACGPGHSYQLIDEHLRKHSNSYKTSALQIYLSHTDWLKQFTKG